MQKNPKSISLLLSLVLIIGLMPLQAFAQDLTIGQSTRLTAQSAAHTQAEAVAWVNSQVTLHGSGNPLGDGQCVWLTYYYYQYLGQAGPTCSYASDYANGSAQYKPSGWSYQSSPQPGDIAVWSGVPGHAAVVTEIRGSQMMCVEQNYAGKLYCTSNLHNIDAQTYIRPDWPSSDTQAPSISNIEVYDVSPTGYWVRCQITDNDGISRVQFPTWTAQDGLDDIQWFESVGWNGSTCYFRIDVSNHGNQRGCNYVTHIYVTDKSGNQTKAEVPAVFVPSAEGNLDSVISGDGTVTIKGWAVDWDNPSTSINVDVYAAGGSGDDEYCGRLTADKARPDVNSEKGVSGNHGFEGTLEIGKRGAVEIHVYALAIAGSGNPRLNLGNATIREPAGGAAAIPEGVYSIRTKLDTSKGLDVASHSTEDLANVQLWTFNAAETGPHCEKFSIEPAGDGSYYIIANHSNKAIEVYQASAESGANVSQYTQNQSMAQRWYFDRNDDGTYGIRHRVSGLAMDVAFANTDDGANIQQHTRNDSDAQKFYLVPTDASMWSISVANQTYSGNQLTPKPTVVAGGVTLKQDSDYTIEYESNTNAGDAKITVKGKGAYTGSQTATFGIKGMNISNASLIGISDKTYDGKAKTQSPTVTLDSTMLKAGEDYNLSYKDNVNAGMATVTVRGKGNYTGTRSATFKINAADVSGASIWGLAAKTYTGKAQAQAPTVKLGGATLKSGTDYTVSYKDNVNVGTATLIVSGKGNYTGTKSATFKINAAKTSKVSLSKATIAGLKAKTYTGKALTQAPTVKVGSKVLTSGTDYAASYKNNVKVGTATITVTGKGNYTGTKSATFKINKAKNPIKVKAKSPSVKAAKVKKANQSIVAKKAYAVSKAQGKVTYKKTSGNKKITVSKAGKITVKKGLKKGTYKVKVKVTAKGNANYKSGSKTVAVKVKVK